MKSIACISRAICCLPLILVTTSTILFAQETNRQNITAEKRTEPKTAEAAPTAAVLYPFHPMNEWVGQRFIFLPGPKSSANSAYEDFSGKVTRKQYQGRIAKVISVSDFGGRMHLEFEMEDTQDRIRARTLPDKHIIMGMALIDDIDQARSQWAGKSLWYKHMMLSTYDEQIDVTNQIPIKRYSRVKVIDVVPGWDEEKPVRFLLETADGKRGFLDLNLSGTNVLDATRHLNRFDQGFMTEDPRQLHKWPAQTWTLIEQSKIVVGMTADQVKMSWGEPEKVTRTAAGENWVYPTGTLTFKNGALIGMKN